MVHGVEAELTTQRTRIMGVLNATPDSFYTPSRIEPTADVLTRARAMVDSGADILDIGGESSRPGSAPVTLEEELGRVLPQLEALHDLDGCCNSAVRSDQRFLDPFPYFLVARVKDSRRQLACERLATRGERIPKATKPAAALLVFSFPGRLVVTEELRPRSGHALLACAGASTRRFETICEMPSGPIVTP